MDIVLEHLDGRVVAIEIKAAASAGLRSDARGLVKLRDKTKDDFVAGIVVYTGGETVKLGDRIWAVPLSALWT